MTRPAAAVAVAVAVTVALAGCGSSAPRHRAGAEPAVSPAPAHRPVGRSVRVGAAAEGIVADARSGLVAVAVRDPPRIVLLSARSGRIVRRVAIAGPARHLSLASRSELLVPEAPINRLLELPLGRRRGGARSIRVGSLPHDAAADDGRVFVADEFGRGVSVLAGGRELRRIGGFTQPGGVAAAGKDVAVVDVGADVIALIDVGTLQLAGRAPAGSGPTHAAAGTDGRVYVVDTRGSAVLTFETRPRLALLGRTPVPGTPYGIASDPGRERLWVTATATNRLFELTTAAAVPRVVASFPTGRQPNTVAVDPAGGDVFIADAAAGTVEIFDPGHHGSLR